MTFWYMSKLTYCKFEKKWADVFQIYQMQSILILSSFVHACLFLAFLCIFLEFFYSFELLFWYFS